MIRPLQGQVLIRVLPPETRSTGGIEIPQRRKSPEEIQADNHHPEPPPPIRGKVLSIGPWKRLKNGMALLPPFPPDSTVLVRDGSGHKLSYGVDDKLRLVNTADILAVLIEST